MGSVLKDLVDSVSTLFSTTSPTSSSSSPPSPSPLPGDRSDAPPPDGAAVGRDVVSERVAHKLKGYFELAKQLIDKAVRAEEWGLVDEAVANYQSANRVLLEGKGVRAPASLSSRENDMVKQYQEKLSKWYEDVSERLKILNRRTGTAGTSATKTGLSNSRNKVASPSVSSSRKMVSKRPINLRISNATAGNITNEVRVAKSSQESGNAYDAKLIEMINSAIVDTSPSVKWEDVAGLDMAKQALLEMVILPTKRRDLFTGLRKPARGLLLFGPPGNGKTMLAKAVASESNATFFNVSASSLTSKWVGEAEKLVKTLFFVAASRQPSVIFMDEIDSIMSTRLANENDASRRLKSEFLIQFDGVTSNTKDLVIVIGATNKPQELDDAVLRRLVKRIYVPLPDENVRRLLLRNQLKGHAFSLPNYDLEKLVKQTEGYSGSDLQALCEEAAMIPIRELGTNILTVKESQVRPLKLKDFQQAMTVIRPSIVKSKWEELERWNKEFGSN